MKAISLWQPWASLIACGAKPYETRSWAPPRKLIGATIAIHAAKKIDKDGAQMATDLMYGQFDNHGGLAERLEASWGGDDACDELMGVFGTTIMPIGCVVCTARLDAAFQLGDRAEGTVVPAASVVKRLISRTMPECFTVRYDTFGDYAPGRWAWLLRDVKPLIPPPPAVGHQGFFDLPQGWMTEIAA
jgi:activating signal cointegrator 1